MKENTQVLHQIPRRTWNRSQTQQREHPRIWQQSTRKKCPTPGSPRQKTSTKLMTWCMITIPLRWSDPDDNLMRCGISKRSRTQSIGDMVQQIPSQTAYAKFHAEPLISRTTVSGTLWPSEESTFPSRRARGGFPEQVAWQAPIARKKITMPIIIKLLEKFSERMMQWESTEL